MSVKVIIMIVDDHQSRSLDSIDSTVTRALEPHHMKPTKVVAREVSTRPQLDAALKIIEQFANDGGHAMKIERDLGDEVARLRADFERRISDLEAWAHRRERGT